MGVGAIEIIVPAVPVAQPRARAGYRHGHISVFTPGTIGEGDNKRPHPIHAFKATLRLAAEQVYKGPPLEGPLRIDVLCVFPRQSKMIWKTKPMPRYRHIQKPDRDNLDKGVLDALKGTMFIDDCQVCDGNIQKWHAAGNEQPHCRILIVQLED
jgi:Holliday junction resolvase RusA-like endonuclease